MKAMNDVVPGRNLPVSYLTNSGAWLTEDDTSEVCGSKPIPGYRTPDGSYIVRFSLTMEDRTWPLKKFWLRLRGKRVIYDLPWQKSLLGSFSPFRMMLPSFVYVEFSSVNGSFSPGKFTSRVPDLGTLITTGPLPVLMSANNMVPAGGEADLIVVDSGPQGYRVNGTEEWFETENEAIDSAGDTFRKKNWRKWSAALDAQSLGGFPEVIIPVCLDCGTRLNGKRVNRQTLFECRKCDIFYEPVKWNIDTGEMTLRLLGSEHAGAAIAAGFTPSMWKFLSRIIGKLR